MENLRINRVNVTFFDIVSSYNSIALQNKSSYEIILEGLNIYLELTGCSSATLFCVDPDSFEFYYKTSTALDLEVSLKNMFERLVEISAVSEALGTASIVESELTEVNGLKNYCIIIPLITPAGVTGLTILTIPHSLKRETLLMDYCLLHSNNFALVINNNSLNYELNQIRESQEQTIALRTIDISKNTRELKKILDSIHIGIMIVNRSTGLITDANLLAAQTIGASKESLINKKRDDYFFAHSSRDFSGETLEIQEGLLKKNNGTLIPIILNQAEVALGGSDFILESFVNISERKKMEDALQQAHFELEGRVEERTSQLKKANQRLEEEILVREKAEADILKLYWAVAQSPVAILITDLTGTIEYVNNKFIDLTGYKFEEAVGSTPRILKSGELKSEDYKSLWDTLLEEREWKGEYRNKKKDGTLFWASTFICPIRNKEGEVSHYLGIQEDITDKKRITDELVIAKERAEESDKLKTTLLSNMSHEFRTPLIGILGFSQFLMEELADQDQASMVKDIEMSGKRLLNTLNGVLSLSELEALEHSLVFEKIDITEQLRYLMSHHYIAAEEKKLKLVVNTDSGPLFISTDSTSLKNSLDYIIDNAIKYTNTGSINVTTGKREDAGKIWAVIEVKDTGIGISPADQKIIFEAFRQASEGFCRYYEGCGLGLTIAKKTIELLHGRITLESELSNGSTFTVWLPAYTEEVDTPQLFEQ